MRGHLVNERYDISGDYSVDAWTFSTGAAMAQGVALNERLTVVFDLRAPFPYAPADVSGYLFASLGVSVML